MDDLYLLDLDRTIFDTSGFGRDLATALATEFGISTDDYVALLPKYVDPETKAHDFFAHAYEMTGASQEAVEAAVERQMSGRSYVYDDLAPWLAARQPHQRVAVVTVGHPSFQTFKFRYAPGTHDLPKIITAVNKGTMIKNALSTSEAGHKLAFLDGNYREISLADDKPDTFTALGDNSAIRGFHIVRPQEPDRPTPTGIKRITGLKEYH